MVKRAHALGLTVVAEGVESAGQCREIWVLGCDSYQGFCFARPMAAEVLGNLLANDSYAARLHLDLIDPSLG